MITFALLSFLASVYDADTLIVYSSGYNNVLQRGVWSSLYLERLLGPELSVSLDGWNSASWDSLSKDLYRSSHNTLALSYVPYDWLSFKSGLSGSSSRTDEADGTQGYTRRASKVYLETSTSTEILYVDYLAEYGRDRTALGGPEGGWAVDETRKDAGVFKIRSPVCTLSVSHHGERHTNWSDRGDTLNAAFVRIPLLAGHVLSGAKLGRRRSTGYTDYEQLGAEFWVRDTMRITPRVGLSMEGAFVWDTLTNNLWESLTYEEKERSLEANVSYRPFKRTSVRLQLGTEQSFHDQADDYYDEEISDNSFTATLSHNFSRRPSYATTYWHSAVNPLSPGNIYFTHSISLERHRTPDTANALDRDNFTERVSLSTSISPAEDFYTYFYFSHYIQRIHYIDTVNTSYAANSNEHKSSYATWNLDFSLTRYLEFSNWAGISFDWINYYNDSTQSRADRTWSEKGSLTFFPEALLQPGISVEWERYENWRVLSGELARTGLKDVVEQRYSLSWVQSRMEEAPSWWWEDSWEKEWLRITGFAGIRMEIVPAEVWQESRFAGADALVRPWPYLSINGGVKFTRSSYETPFEASLSVYSSF